MSTLVKLTIAICAVFLIACVGVTILAAGSLGAVGLVAARTIQVNPAVVDASASRIADFTLPSGYRAEATAEIAGYVYVSYAPGDGHSHIQFIQGPKDAVVDQATVEGYLQQAGAKAGYYDRKGSRVVGTGEATIRGQAVTLLIAEAINHDGQPFRTVSAAFQGKGGPAFVSVESPISSWNQEMVDQFIASIR